MIVLMRLCVGRARSFLSFFFSFFYCVREFGIMKYFEQAFSEKAPPRFVKFSFVGNPAKSNHPRPLRASYVLHSVPYLIIAVCSNTIVIPGACLKRGTSFGSHSFYPMSRAWRHLGLISRVALLYSAILRGYSTAYELLVIFRGALDYPSSCKYRDRATVARLKARKTSLSRGLNPIPLAQTTDFQRHGDVPWLIASVKPWRNKRYAFRAVAR